MKVSELALHLRSYLQQNPDCDVKLFSESVVYGDVFDSSEYEDVTDIRSVNDWPLPGDSLVMTEATPKHLVIFYDQEKLRASSPQKTACHGQSTYY